MTYCCEEFAKNTGTLNKGFEYYAGNGTWSVNGCCGGGCYVLVDITYCPYCGTKLQPPGETDDPNTQ